MPNAEVKDCLGFGTYRLKPATARNAVAQALRYTDIAHIDTALMYNNDNIVKEVVDASKKNIPVSITSKIKINSRLYKDLISKEDTTALTEEVIRLTDLALLRAGHDATVLLHRPYSVATLRALAELKHRQDKPVKKIGVCNVSSSHLEQYFADGISIDVIQVEMHPLVPVDGLMKTIAATYPTAEVQAHTPLARGALLQDSVVLSISRRINASPAQVLLAYPLRRGAHRVIGSTVILTHLLEWPAVPETAAALTDDDVKRLSERYKSYGVVRYIDNQEVVDKPYQRALDLHRHDMSLEELRTLLETVQRDIALIMEQGVIPADKGALLNSLKDVRRSPVGISLAMMWRGDTHNNKTNDADAAHRAGQRAVALARNDLLCARKRLEVLEQERKVFSKFGATCCLRKRPIDNKLGSVFSVELSTPDTPSDVVLHPQAMPIDIAPSHEFNPLLEFMSVQRAPIESPVRFPKACLFPDGRLDLCKQGLGATNITKICEAAKSSPLVKHFLLGNNIVCKDETSDRKAGVKALSALIANSSAGNIETYYLAGNDISGEDMEVLCDALLSNHEVKEVWLKRNPLGHVGGLHISRLLCQHNTLVTLDLNNTGLGNEGVTALSGGLAKCISVRNLYLEANGITSLGARNLAAAFKELPHRWEVLYFGLNMLQLEGCMHLIRGLAGAEQLKCLSLGSTALSIDNTEVVCDMVAQHLPDLQTLILGNHKATKDLGEHPNQISAASAIKLLESHHNLKVLNVSKMSLTSEETERVYQAAQIHKVLLFGKDVIDKKYLHATTIGNIESIYRTEAM